MIIWRNQLCVHAQVTLVSSDSLRPCALWPARLLCPWGFSRQEYWGGLPFLCPGNIPKPGIKPRSPALQADSLLYKEPGIRKSFINTLQIILYIKIKGIYPIYGLPKWPSGKEYVCQCRRQRMEDSVPVSGRSSGGGCGNPLQFSCLENPMDRRS